MNFRRTRLHRTALGVAASLALGACTRDDSAVAPPTPLDIPSEAVVPFDGTVIDMSALANEVRVPTTAFGGAPTYDAVFRQAAFETSSGTGIVDPFLKTNTNDATYNAFNTSATGNARPATVSACCQFTRALPLSGVPTVKVTINGATNLYREIRLDIHEPDNDTDKLLSLDRFDVYIANAGNVPTNGNNTPNFTGIANYKAYGFPAGTYMKMDGSLSSGSGSGDVFFYIPETAINPTDAEACPYDGGTGDCGKYLVLSVAFGGQTTMTQEGTFEEFAVRRFPYATKTATYTYDNAISWQITKQVKRSTESDASYGASTSFDLWNGENATANYKVTVTKTVNVTSPRITGVISLINPTNKDFTGISWTDVFDGTAFNSEVANCPTTVPANSTVTCNYTLTLAAAPPAAARNRATATFDAGTGLQLSVTGLSGQVGAGTLGNTTGFNTINVSDNLQGALGSTSANQTFTYNRNFACAANKGTTNNTATITETGQTANASVVTRCYELQVSKTATPAFARTYSWDITKQVKKQGAADNTYGASTTYNMFVGDEGVVTYKVVATRNVTDGSYNVSGNITVTNPSTSSGPVTLQSLSDLIDNGGGSATIGACTLDGAPFAIPASIPANKSVICAYTKTGVSSNPGSTTFTNTANATGRITKAQTGTTDDKAFSGSATFSYVGVTPSTMGPATVTVTDNFNGAGAQNLVTNYDGSSPIPTYDRTLSCSTTGSTTYPNTAEIVQTSQTASAGVTINCYNISVAKTAQARLRRTWPWTLVKAKDDAAAGQVQPTTITLGVGQTYTYYYKVTATAGAPVDDQFGVGGTITVTNNAPAGLTAAIASVVDTVNQGGTKTACPVTGAPATIAGSANAQATYDCVLPNGTNGKNIATARTQNRRFTGTGSTNLSGTTLYGDSVAVTFPGTITRVNDCVNVYDDRKTPQLLGTVCADNATRPFAYDLSPKTFNYSLTLPALSSCGASQTFINTASTVFRLSNGTLGSAATPPSSITLTLQSAPCTQGCTLTQGYWKTHNSSFGQGKNGGRKGPPIHDWTGTLGGTAWSTYDRWQFFVGTPSPVPTGNPAITPVPTPTQASPNWFETWTTPPKGNPYYNAAHQFMAAMANVANGANPTAVNTELYAAYNFFLTASPATAWTDQQKSQLLAWNGLFGSYNEGSIGPGHCSEDRTSQQ